MRFVDPEEYVALPDSAFDRPLYLARTDTDVERLLKKGIPRRDIVTYAEIAPRPKRAKAQPGA